jgi:hypothetical protein
MLGETMDVARIDELGVAGYIDEDLRALVAGTEFSVDDYWSIGIAGPVTPELLRRVVELGPARVAESVHSVIAGPVDPDELGAMIEIGLSDAVAAAFATGRAPFDSGWDLLRAIAARAT